MLQLGEGTAILSGLFLQESRLVVTRHAAASIGVWHVASGALIAFFACDDPVEHISCTPHGTLALGTQSGALHFIQLPVRSAPRSFASQPPSVAGVPRCRSCSPCMMLPLRPHPLPQRSSSSRAGLRMPACQPWTDVWVMAGRRLLVGMMHGGMHAKWRR